MKIKRFFTKTKIKLVLLKFALYKFLGNFIPYFKNQLNMLLVELKENIKNILNSILEEKFNKKFIIENISDSYIDEQYDNIFHDNTSNVKYSGDNVDKSKLCFVMNMKHHGLPIKVTVIYLEKSLSIKFKTPDVGTDVFDDCKLVENILYEEKERIIETFNTYKLSHKN